MDPVALGPGRAPTRGEGGGGSPLAWRNGAGLTSVSRPPAFRGLGGGGVAPGFRVALLRWLWCMSPAAMRGGLKAQAWAPYYCRGPLRVRGAALRRLGRAVTAWGGGALSLSCPVACQWLVGGVRQGGLVRSSLRRARTGLSGVLRRRARPGGLAAGGSVPAVVSIRVLCAAGGLLQSPPLRALARGQLGGGGDQGGGHRLWGLVPVGGAPRAADPYSPPPALQGRATGRRAVVLALAPGPAAARGVAAASCGAVGGAGGGPGVRRRWGRGPGSAVSGQWSAGQRDSFAARVRVPRAVGVRPRPSQSPGLGVTLVHVMSCWADGGGGGGRSV